MTMLQTNGPPERTSSQPVDESGLVATSRQATGYRTAVVHLKSYEEASEHINVALRLAAKFGTEVTGLLTQRDISVFKKLFAAHAVPAERIAASEQQALEFAERFRRLASEHQVTATFQVAEGDAAELLTYVGRRHDLVVVEQTNLKEDEIGFDVPEYCVAGTGRPVLIVPCSGEFPEVGRRVLIAWNGSREATLAIHHALPLLRQAEHVTLLEGECKERFPSITRWPKASIQSYLERQGIQATTVRFDQVAGEIGPAINAEATECGADLIVMGAYGRSWLSEWVLGGATRYMLSNTRVPLLMAN